MFPTHTLTHSSPTSPNWFHQWGRTYSAGSWLPVARHLQYDYILNVISVLLFIFISVCIISLSVLKYWSWEVMQEKFMVSNMLFVQLLSCVVCCSLERLPPIVAAVFILVISCVLQVGDLSGWLLIGTPNNISIHHSICLHPLLF